MWGRKLDRFHCRHFKTIRVSWAKTAGKQLQEVLLLNLQCWFSSQQVFFTPLHSSHLLPFLLKHKNREDWGENWQEEKLIQLTNYVYKYRKKKKQSTPRFTILSINHTGNLRAGTLRKTSQKPGRVKKPNICDIVIGSAGRKQAEKRLKRGGKQDKGLSFKVDFNVSVVNHPKQQAVDTRGEE